MAYKTINIIFLGHMIISVQILGQVEQIVAGKYGRAQTTFSPDIDNVKSAGERFRCSGQCVQQDCIGFQLNETTEQRSCVIYKTVTDVPQQAGNIFLSGKRELMEQIGK